jgi:predicted adenylyl cyclase CyaB
MLTYKDFTLKAHLNSRSEIEQKLIELGARFEGEDYQLDYYFKVSTGKLKYRKGTLGTLITHYERFSIDNIEKTAVYRYDINPSEEEVRQLYTNFDLVGEIQKSRSLYQINNLTIHLDKLENGDEFIEVEAKDFEELYTELDLQNQCHQLFEKMGISKNELLKTGYVNL